MIPHVTSSHQSLLSTYSFLPCALKKEVFICLFVFIEEMVLVSNSVCIHWCDRCTLYSHVPAQEHFVPGGSPRPGYQPASGEASDMDQHRSGLQKLTGPTWKGHFLCTWWGCQQGAGQGSLWILQEDLEASQVQIFFFFE